MFDRELPLFPLNVVLFPGMRLPLHVFEERYQLMIGTCMVSDQTFGVSLIRSGLEVGGPAEVFEVGTTARIVEIDRLPGGRMNLMTIGVNRFRILERLDDQPYASARVELLTESPGAPPDILIERLTRQFRRYLVENGAPPEQAESLQLPDDSTTLSYFIASTLRAPARQRQQILEEDLLETRLRRVLAALEWATGGPSESNARSFTLN